MNQERLNRDSTFQVLLGALIILFFSILPGLSAKAKTEKKIKTDRSPAILGRVEYGTIREVSLVLKARLDTGAGVSSIHAADIKIVKNKKTGRKYAKFKITNESGKKKTLKKQIIKWMKIKHKHQDGYTKRPVVRLKICIGDRTVEGRVNIADRSNFIYPLLIGRNILKQGPFLVDARKKFNGKPTCPS